MDHGAVYASKTIGTSDGRRVRWDWVYEMSSGCYQQCGSGSALTEALVRQGAGVRHRLCVCVVVWVGGGEGLRSNSRPLPPPLPLAPPPPTLPAAACRAGRVRRRCPAR